VTLVVLCISTVPVGYFTERPLAGAGRFLVEHPVPGKAFGAGHESEISAASGAASDLDWFFR
jgi:hypothetical protein